MHATHLTWFWDLGILGFMPMEGISLHRSLQTTAPLMKAEKKQSSSAEYSHSGARTISVNGSLLSTTYHSLCRTSCRSITSLERTAAFLQLCNDNYSSNSSIHSVSETGGSKALSSSTELWHKVSKSLSFLTQPSSLHGSSATTVSGLVEALPAMPYLLLRLLLFFIPRVSSSPRARPRHWSSCYVS